MTPTPTRRRGARAGLAALALGLLAWASAFSLANGAFVGYALAAFVGLGAAAEDVRTGLAARLGRVAGTAAGRRRPAAPPRAQPEPAS